MTGLQMCCYCGVWHLGTCPRIKSIEYHQNGTIKKVEFHEDFWVFKPEPLNPQHENKRTA